MTAGLGIAVLPESLRRLRIAELHYRPIRGPEALSGLWVIHQPGQAQATTQMFLSKLLAMVGEEGRAMSLEDAQILG